MNASELVGIDEKSIEELLNECVGMCPVLGRVCAKAVCYHIKSTVVLVARAIFEVTFSQYSIIY